MDMCERISFDNGRGYCDHETEQLTPSPDSHSHVLSNDSYALIGMDMISRAS